MSEFKTIETQEQFDQMVQDRLERARESVRKEYQDYGQLKEQVTAYQKEKESYESKIKELTDSNSKSTSEFKELSSKYKALETDSLKVKIALENGLPYELASRINGTDEESIRKDAEVLKSFASKSFTSPRRNPEAKPQEEDAYLKMVKSLNK